MTIDGLPTLLLSATDRIMIIIKLSTFSMVADNSNNTQSSIFNDAWRILSGLFTDSTTLPIELGQRQSVISTFPEVGARIRFTISRRTLIFV